MAQQLVELVAVGWRAGRTGHGHHVLAVFDCDHRGPVGMSRSKIDCCDGRQRTAPQLVKAAGVMGDHLVVARDVGAPQVVHPDTKARSDAHGVDDEVNSDGAYGCTTASRHNVHTDASSAAALSPT